MSYRTHIAHTVLPGADLWNIDEGGFGVSPLK